MLAYYKRLLEDKIAELAQHFKVILLTGARQVGKSTILQHLFPDSEHIVFDGIRDIYQARGDPDLFIQNRKLPVILDEIQYAPEVLSSLKRFVDEHPEKGQFLLTGSQNFSMMQGAAESLAGRVAILNLRGMTPYEWLGNFNHWFTVLLDEPLHLKTRVQGVLKLPCSLYELLWRGQLPEVFSLPTQNVFHYHQAYLQTYIERDVRLLENIRDLTLFDRFVGVVAALSSEGIEYQTLAKTVGINHQTVERWLHILLHSDQWFEVLPYFNNDLKKLSKRRKGYFADTGMMCYLMGISSPEALSRHPLLGAVFETYCVNLIKTLNATLNTPARLFHFRKHSGSEVDVILERNGQLFPIEIKCKSWVDKNDARGVVAFMEHHPQASIPLGVILHAGTEAYFVKENILALPVLSFLSPLD